MGSRPTRLARWAYDAPGGQLVEPPSSFARQGFYSGERPPAQWVNYLLHFQGAWCDYLAGPGWGAWTRLAHGGSAPVFTAVAAMAVDTDDTRASKGNWRYALAGTKAGPATVLAVSRTGREWLEREAPGSSTSLLGLLWTDSTCIVWGKKGSPFETWWTPVEGGSSAIATSDWSLWSTVGDLSGVEVRGMARVAPGQPWALTDNGAGVVTFMGSSDGGASWPTAHAVTPGLASGALSSDLAWDDTRARFLVTSTKGDVFTWTPSTPGAAGTPLVLPGATGTPRVRVCIGDGVCVAWASVDAAGAPLGSTLLWRSDDGGTTWEAVTLPSLMASAGGAAIVTDVTYADGVWVATTTAAPYLWRSDDGGATWERVALPLGEESSWALHRAVYADGAVTATGLTWTVATTRATGLAPDASRVYSPEPGYLADAGYLRGRRIAATAPTDGQGLVWDASGGVWTPETVASGPSLSDATPAALGVAAAGTSPDAARADHVHALPTGIPTIGSGTYAARPASPSVGDSYTVTSGARRGSVYRCDVAGSWSLVTLAVPQLGACVAIFDGEHGVGRVGSVLNRWVNLAPRGRGYDLTYPGTGNAPQPLAASAVSGLLLEDTSSTTTPLRTILPSATATGARTIAALVRPTGYAGITTRVMEWGTSGALASIGLCSRESYVDKWIADFRGSPLASTVDSIEAGLVVAVATYDGTTVRLYREGTEIASGARTLANGADAYLAVMSGVSADAAQPGTLAFAGAWDAALSAGEVSTLTSLLRERYGL